jgi:hypothetical protein
MSFAAFFIAALSSCDKDPVAVADGLSGSRPAFNVGDPDYQCPRQVHPDDCEELTASERQDLWVDIEFGIKWYDPNCAAVGEAMQDFVLTGDVRKYDDRQYDNTGVVGAVHGRTCPHLV